MVTLRYHYTRRGSLDTTEHKRTFDTVELAAGWFNSLGRCGFTVSAISMEVEL